MNNMKNFRESRKKDILHILLSNPCQAILLLKLLPARDLKAMLETIFEKHIIPRFGVTAKDSLVHKMMGLAHDEWKRDFENEIDKLIEQERCAE